jgi:hypothetical protein
MGNAMHCSLFTRGAIASMALCLLFAAPGSAQAPPAGAVAGGTAAAAPGAGAVGGAAAPPAQPVPAIPVPQAFADTSSGQTVAVAGTNLAGKTAVVTLRSAANQETAATVREVSDRQIVFVVPAIATGRYSVMVAVAGAEARFVGTLGIVGVAPVIRRIDAISSWRDLLRGRFDFTIVGERLTTGAGCSSTKAEACGFTLVMDDQPIALTHCANAATPGANAGCFVVEEPSRRVSVLGFTTQEEGGSRQVRVAAGETLSEPKTLHVTRVTSRTIKWTSFVLFVAGLLGFILLGRQRHSSPTGNSVTLRLASWALLDEQTNSYSLSKLQILLWASVVAYCYVYLYLARVFVQGQLDDLPAVPASFGWLLGLTGGTSVLSLMLTRTRGSKGAGDAVPLLSDLVSTGGVLAPERAQYLTWTVIGCIGYVVLVLRKSPELLSALPTIDNQLLMVMGLSAGVYIGGKAVRLPGPVLNEVQTGFAAGTSTLTLRIKGQNIHRDTLVTLDGSPVQVVRAPGAATPGAVDPSLLSAIDLDIVGGQWATGDHLLRLTNLDGQYAETWFTHAMPQITNVTDGAAGADTLTAGTSEILVTITGTSLRDGSSADWLPPGATTSVVIPADKVAVTGGTTATIRVTVGAAKGSGVFGLVSPRGIRVSRPATVV